MKAKANKQAQMSLNASKFASAYWRLLFRIEPYQWVTGDSNKNFADISPVRLVPVLSPLIMRLMHSLCSRRLGLCGDRIR